MSDVIDRDGGAALLEVASCFLCSIALFLLHELNTDRILIEASAALSFFEK